ncbi:CTP synthetase [Leifsonia xyli subsp. cynodontis DSM 46306]|uniref:Ricin B lectin domain-containing protein n=1 Tax=Leifsonia xyli subsp. cynodontis DSM 46306 TaxID=1389489 RepID=U3P599_LEIXC|nr:RICIN domain-containing protein [Leifsonia xyli]AGW41485.1 CTP synthetase [Leifsonia xyli subsp. cynodontis DSM 46306]
MFKKFGSGSPGSDGGRGRSRSASALALVLIGGSLGIAAPALIPGTAIAASDTPALYTESAAHPTGQSAVFTTTVGLKPSKDAQTFWSHQFQVGNQLGSIGFQSTEDGSGRNLWLFSTQGVTGCEPSATDGGQCVGPLDGKSEASARIWKTWQAGRTYALKIAAVADRAGWWRASVVDGSDGTETALGTLRFANGGTRLLPLRGWVGFYQLSEPGEQCAKLEDSDVTFGPFQVDGKSFRYSYLNRYKFACTNAVLRINDDGSAFLASHAKLKPVALLSKPNALAVTPDASFWSSAIRLQPAQSDDAHDWLLRSDGTIRTTNDRWCLTEEPETFWHGKRVALASCSSASNRVWSQVDGHLKNEATGLCLATSDHSTYPGARLVTAPCSRDADQEFVSVQPQSIMTRRPGTYLWADASVRSQTPVATRSSVPDLGWKMLPDGTIRSRDDKQCLDLSGSSSANGTPIILWACTGGINQKWTTTPEGELRTRMADDVCATVQENGNVAGYRCTGGTNQTFWF